MPKKIKTATASRTGVPMPVRVQEDDEFRLVAMSLEGKTLAVESL